MNFDLEKIYTYPYFYPLLVIFSLIILWIAISYFAYRNTIKMIEDFITKDITLKKEEVRATDFYVKSGLMTERMHLHSKYPELRDYSFYYIKDKKESKRKLLKLHMKYGIFYYFWDLI